MNPLIQSVTTMNEPRRRQPGSGRASVFYDLLFVTRDSALWNDYSLFFQYEQPALRIGYVQGADKLKPIMQRLTSDGLLLLDLRHPDDAKALAQPGFWEAFHEKTTAIGLADTEHFPTALMGGPAVRLDAVVAAGLPAPDNWVRIQNTRDALQKPLMSLRIENVAIADILQMLTMSERSSNVFIRGRARPEAPLTEGRLFFQKGMLEFALSNRRSGDDAVMDILRLRQGTIEVFTCYGQAGIPNIRVSLDKLLLDYAVGYDESASREEAASPTPAAPEVAELIDQAPEPDSADLDNALSAGTWGAPTAENEIPDRFRGVHPFQMFRSRWSDIPQTTLDILEQTDEGALPMEWLQPAELAAQLEASPEQRVIALRGSLDFLICMLASWHASFHVDRFCDGYRPVIRIGEDGRDSVWFVGDLDDQPLDILRDYPCAVWTEPRESDLTLRHTAAAGHPAVILMTSDIKLYTVSLNWGLAYEGRVTVPHDCIIAQADSWSHVRHALTNLLKVLKGMAARCK